MAEKQFFDEEEKETTEEPSKITLGEEEYSQEELEKLVGKGKIAVEAEERYNRPIDKFWPEYTKTKQQLSEMEKELEGFKSQQQETAQQPGRQTTSPDQMTEEQVKQQALQQADQLGLIHKGNVQDYVNEVVQGYRLLDNVNDILQKAKSEGRPATDTSELLNFMEERGIRNPEDAYQIMFKDELRTLEQEKVEGVKKEGLKTQEGSEAGSEKKPQQTPITKDNLQEALRANLASKAGSEK